MTEPTAQEWEQQGWVPEGPARVLLHVIERDPAAVARALAGGKQGLAPGGALDVRNTDAPGNLHDEDVQDVRVIVQGSRSPRE